MDTKTVTPEIKKLSPSWPSIVVFFLPVDGQTMLESDELRQNKKFSQSPQFGESLKTGSERCNFLATMVTSKSVSVSLVDATTLEPFKEHHASDGNVYAEVEPKVEYFVRVKNESTTLRVFCSIFVDGNYLGYDSTLPPDSQGDKGIWSRCNGIETMKALRFELPSDIAESSDHETFSTGSVEVRVFEAGSSYEKFATDFASSWSKSTGDNPVPESLKGKAVNSGKGSSTFQSYKMNKNDSFVFYEKGRLLTSIKLWYCTAVGLIHVGVLPKPPAWDLLRKEQPWTEKTLSDPNDRRHLEVEPGSYEKTIRRDDQVVGMEKCVMYDLSHL